MSTEHSSGDESSTPRERTCTGCETKLTGNHAIRNGDRYCFDCRPPQYECAQEDTGRGPETVGEYNASKASVVSVAVLMDGGSV